MALGWQTHRGGLCGIVNPRTKFGKLVVGVTVLCIIIVVHDQLTSETFENLNLDESMRSSVIESLLKVSADLASTARQSDCSETCLQASDCYYEINKLLVRLGHAPPSGPELTSSPDHVANEGDVCQEKYIYKNLLGGYPLWHKGFEMEDCSGVPKFYTLLTLVYNFVHYSSEELEHLPEIFRSVNEAYPKLKIIAAIPSSLRFKANNFYGVKTVKFDSGELDTDVWNVLMTVVRTKYVYIGRNVIRFTWFDRLERLVRQINNLNASVVASAFRTLQSGEWSHGCEQSILRGYSLVYRDGYDVSVEECLLCDHVHGPFVTKTEFLKKNPLPSEMSDTSGFAVWLLQVRSSGYNIVVCPDAMSFVTDSSRLPTTKQDWKDLAHYMQVEKVQTDRTQTFEFGCDEADTSCSKVKQSGLMLSTCCREELSDGVKLVMKKCEEAGHFCSIQHGTMLGAVKFDSILPYELDADLGIHIDNISAFNKKLKPFFVNKGYDWETGIADGRRFYKIFTPASRWKIEIYPSRAVAAVNLIKKGISPTLIKLDGAYVQAPAESPGLYARNRFSYGLYQHVQHHQQLSDGGEWTFYTAKKFTQCPKPKHHSCLDQFVADGNMMYRYAAP